MSKFTVFYDGECTTVYEMEEPVISIGRLPENSISIANMGVSRRHAKIEEDADRKYVITDLNSLNGTFLNGKRIKKTHLTHGDMITIGKYTVLYEEPVQHENLTIQEQSNNEFDLESEEIIIHSEDIDDRINIIQEEGENKSENQLPSVSDSVSENRIISDELSEGVLNYNALLEEETNLKDIIDQKSYINGAVLIETNKHVVYKLDKKFITMGNGDNDDIFVSGFLISENQILIEKNDNGYIICANKLMGKFKINGKSVKTHLLKHKDRIEFGSSTFRYMENG